VRKINMCVIVGLYVRNTRVWCSVLQCAAVCCSVLQCASVFLRGEEQCTERPPGSLQHIATHCNTLQHTATHLQHITTHCNTLQHTAAHCSTLLLLYRLYAYAYCTCMVPEVRTMAGEGRRKVHRAPARVNKIP